ncbi:MAG: hypothetical protein JWP58_657, partial [Hymenobacter sp.]|nr:hypothetical protein [Hymenobacter sp.]
FFVLWNFQAALRAAQYRSTEEYRKVGRDEARFLRHLSRIPTRYPWRFLLAFIWFGC